MDFWEIAKLLVRRWMISLPLLVVAGAAGAVPLSQVKPNYVALAHVQLVPPVVTHAELGKPTAEQRNPWLGLGPRALGNAVIVTVTDQYMTKALKKAGLSDKFTVTLNDQTPLVTFEITGKSRGQAIATANRLVDRFTASTRELQAAYPVAPEDMIHAHRLGNGADVEKSNSTFKRAVAAAGAAGFLATVGLTVAIDALLCRRRRRRADRAARAAVSESGDDSPSDQETDQPTGRDT